MARRERKARPRERHEQLELLNKRGTGKARRKAKARRAKPVEAPRKRGRPIKGDRAGAPHKKRESFKASEPVHVVLRVEEKGLGGLRRRNMYRALREATLAVASREDFRIVHISIQGTHIHLLVEAGGKTALARGMQAFQISAAKRMNAVLTQVDPETHEPIRRRGKVFSDRYHAEVIRSRRQARHALAYVLNNWRKHREDRGVSWKVDRYSSGIAFRGWKAFADPGFAFTIPADYEPLVVWEPRTWLLREGWMMYGRLDFNEVPSAPARRARGTARTTVAR
jgi:REP element-mobilizing transposase RayT